MNLSMEDRAAAVIGPDVSPDLTILRKGCSSICASSVEISTQVNEFSAVLVRGRPIRLTLNLRQLYAKCSERRRSNAFIRSCCCGFGSIDQLWMLDAIRVCVQISTMIVQKE